MASPCIVDGRLPGCHGGSDGLPPLSDTTDYPALKAELEGLDQALDAVTDATIAESVYQVVQGNPVRAGAVLDAINRGETAPPELEVVRIISYIYFIGIGF